MLYRIGTKAEAQTMQTKLPKSAYRELLRCADILDEAYGAERNYLKVGGYFMIAETYEDICKIKKVVDYETALCEWVKLIPGIYAYISVLYLLGDDYSVVIFMPLAVAPKTILNQLKEKTK